MNVLLSATGQSQLSQLKAANNLPLTRLDTKSKELTTKQGLVVGATKAVEALKVSLTALKASTGPMTPAATADFIAKFNALQEALKSQTAKGTTLSTVSSVRHARSELRQPFQDIGVLNGLSAAGIDTTREGLVATSNAAPAPLDDASYSAILANLSKISGELTQTSDGEGKQLTAIATQRARAQILVDATNARTETSFLKMYNIMQNLTNSTGTSIPTH
jgi:flagellar capping protein FliD